jgi:hypothetical protein
MNKTIVIIVCRKPLSERGEKGEELLEPELRPQYVEKLEKIKRQQGHRFRSMAELKRHIENA